MTAPVQNRVMDDLIVSWEGQQDAYIRHSAWRFGSILDTIGCTRRVPATFLDLTEGPGPFSRRLLKRYPGAKRIARKDDAK